MYVHHCAKRPSAKQHDLQPPIQAGDLYIELSTEPCVKDSRLDHGSVIPHPPHPCPQGRKPLASLSWKPIFWHPASSRQQTCNVLPTFELQSTGCSGMLPQLMSSRALPRLPGAALRAAALSSPLSIRSGIQTCRRRRAYSSTRRAENYLPMVLESTPRGERAYDIYSRLLRVSPRYRAASDLLCKGGAGNLSWRTKAV